MEKLNIKYPIIVEGKYDKIKLSSIVCGNIITTDGFGVFKNGEKLSLLKKLSEKTPVIILTDSDGGGKVIRSHITSAISKDRLIQLYIPQINGREKRKTENSAEGYLGVEGMRAELLYDLLAPFADTNSFSVEVRGAEISKVDFYSDGLSGRENSSERRDALAALLGLPRGMSANSLLEAVKVLCTYEEYKNAVGQISTSK